MPVQSLVRLQLCQYKKAMYFFLLLSKNGWFSYTCKIKRYKFIDQNQKFLKKLIIFCDLKAMLQLNIASENEIQRMR